MSIELEKGRTYFKLTYSDVEFTMPGVDPMVYIGKNVFLRRLGDDRDTYQFQDTISYQRHGYVTDLDREKKDECRVEAFSENEIGSSILTLEEISIAVNESLAKANKLGNPKLSISSGEWVVAHTETWIEVAED